MEREGGLEKEKEKERKVETGWLLDDGKNGATGLHWIVRDGPVKGLEWSEIQEGVGEANDIHSHSSVGSGCCANEPQRRCEYRWYTVGNGERERERACYVAYVRACVRLFRARCYQRSCRFIPVLLPRHTCFREYGAGPRCARIFAARWNFVISIPGNPERVSLPSETSDTAVGKKEKKPRNASRVSARVFPRVACVAFLA